MAFLDEQSVGGDADECFRKSLIAEVGLLVGTNLRSKSIVLLLLPTPVAPAELDPHSLPTAAVKSTNAWQHDSTLKKASKSKSHSSRAGHEPGNSDSLVFEDDWIGEHARQVSKMLPGGLSVLGLFVFCKEGSFKLSQPSIIQTVKSVRAAVSSRRSGSSDVFFVLHIATDPKKFSLRSVSWDGPSLKPCQVSFGSFLGSFLSFTASYHFSIELPVPGSSPDHSVRSLLEKAIAEVEAELASAEAASQGELLSLVAKVRGDEASTRVDFLAGLRMSRRRVWSQADCPAAAGFLRFAGAVEGLCYVYQQESYSAAMAGLKADIVSSLRSRLDLLVDEWENGGQPDEGLSEDQHTAAGAAAAAGLSPLQGRSFSCSMPSRVFAPVLPGIKFCDYLLPGETAEDVRERFKSLLSADVTIEAVEEAELPAELMGMPGTPSVDVKPPSKAVAGSSAGLQLGAIALFIALLVILTAVGLHVVASQR